MLEQTIPLALVPVFFVMALGYGAGKLGIVDARHSDSLNALVMNFAVPASIFVATATAPRAEMIAQAPLFAVFGAIMLLLFLAWLAFLKMRPGATAPDAPMQALTIAFPNLAGVGLPIGAALLGPTGMVPVALALAAGSLIVSPLALIFAEMGRGGQDIPASARILPALGASIRKPVVIAPAIGVMLSLAEIHLGPVAIGSFRLIGNAGAGVALFLTGLVLSTQAFRLDTTVAAGTLLGDVVRPLAMAGVVMLLRFPPELARAAIIIAAVPSGFFGILFAINYRLDTRVSGSLVIASTLLSAITMTVTIVLVSAAGGV